MKSRFLCTEDLKTKLPRLSFSSIKNFLRCPEIYYLNNIQGITKKPYMLGEPLKAGTMWGLFFAAMHGQPQSTKHDLISIYQPSDITMAKVNALTKAYRDLEVHTDKSCICEKEFFIPFHKWQLYGFIDRAYDDYIVESKLTTRPENYLTIPDIRMQAGTYLYTNPAYEYVVMEITRMPSLYLGKQTKKNPDGESIEAYENRIYSDIIRRPSYYFIGWNAQTKTFGKKFYRSEFDFHELVDNYHKVAKLLRYTIDNDLWCKNELACHSPFDCDYLPVRKTGVISEEIYEIKSKQR
jgi:hypothetical protein